MLGCIQPMSSPMMKRMFGFGDGCCAFVGAVVANAAANDPIKPSKIFLPVMIEAFPSVRLKNANAGPYPSVAGSCTRARRLSATTAKRLADPWGRKNQINGLKVDHRHIR